jgi:hypothetical protein
MHAHTIYYTRTCISYTIHSRAHDMLYIHVHMTYYTFTRISHTIHTSAYHIIHTGANHIIYIQVHTIYYTYTHAMHRLSVRLTAVTIAIHHASNTPGPYTKLIPSLHSLSRYHNICAYKTDRLNKSSKAKISIGAGSGNVFCASVMLPIECATAGTTKVYPVRRSGELTSTTLARSGVM